MRKFYRSSDEKIVGDVCAGLAQYFDLNLVRRVPICADDYIYEPVFE